MHDLPTGDPTRATGSGTSDAHVLAGLLYREREAGQERRRKALARQVQGREEERGATWVGGYFPRILVLCPVTNLRGRLEESNSLNVSPHPHAHGIIALASSGAFSRLPATRCIK